MKYLLLACLLTLHAQGSDNQFPAISQGLTKKEYYERQRTKDCGHIAGEAPNGKGERSGAICHCLSSSNTGRTESRKYGPNWHPIDNRAYCARFSNEHNLSRGGENRRPTGSSNVGKPARGSCTEAHVADSGTTRSRVSVRPAHSGNGGNSRVPNTLSIQPHLGPVELRELEPTQIVRR